MQSNHKHEITSKQTQPNLSQTNQQSNKQNISKPTKSQNNQQAKQTHTTKSNNTNNRAKIKAPNKILTTKKITQNNKQHQRNQ